MAAGGAGQLVLEPLEQEMLAGWHGPAPALAMQMVVQLAGAMGASRLFPITGAHIDACLFQGRAGLDFARRLVDLDGRVAVPTTLNVTSIDTLHPDLVDVPADHVRAATELAEAYRRLGAVPTFTCAPYLVVRPALGEHVAWAESNAIVFANSVLGARTNRYGDFIDICAALTGRVPAAGLHLGEHRLAEVVVEVDLPRQLLDHDAGWAALGCAIGSRVGGKLPAIVGIDPGLASEDRLKAFGAGAASSGSVAMFHLVGRTPEAVTLELAAGGGNRAQGLPRIRIGAGEVRAARAGLSTLAAGAAIDAVALGTPHFSALEFRELDTVVRDTLGSAGQGSARGSNGEIRSPLRVPIVVTTSRHVLSDLDATMVRRLRGFGITIAVDTCSYLTPMLGGARRVVTSSAKWAWYAPANLGVQVALATMAECVASAQAGRVMLDEGRWGARAGVQIAADAESGPPAEAHPTPAVTSAQPPATRTTPAQPPAAPTATRPAKAPAARTSPAPTQPATRTLPVRVLAPGRASGPLLVLDEPLSLWGGTEPGTGRISDIHHPQHGVDLAGAVVAMPASRGSSSSAAVLAEAIRAGYAPAAIVLGEVDTLLVMGCLVARELYGRGIPIVVSDYAELRRAGAAEVAIEAESGQVSLRLDRREGSP